MILPILYFPKVKNQFEIQKNKVQLYCNQVFITDQLEGIIPEFMMLLHGVIDSPDIPLNVSRSYLQSDANVKKISSHITKKVAEKLEDMFKNNREDFEKKWDDLKVFLQYGSITDEKFYDRIKDIFLLKNIENQWYKLALKMTSEHPFRLKFWAGFKRNALRPGLSFIFNREAVEYE